MMGTCWGMQAVTKQGQDLDGLYCTTVALILADAMLEFTGTEPGRPMRTSFVTTLGL